LRFILIACVLVAGCTGLPPGSKSKPLAQTAADAITVGKSTKADVRAALGEAISVDFESGYEVWVYRERLREKMPPPATEFVLLFDPSGILTKTSIR